MKPASHLTIFFIFHIILFSSASVKAQSVPVNGDSLLQMVRDAYIYGYPIEQVYRMYVTLPDNTGQTQKIYNHFSYADKLASAASDNAPKIAAYKKTRNRGGAGPNNDTPYFGSLLDLSDGPLVLSIPDFGDRYFSFHFINFFNENVFYIGSSFGDTTAGKYLLIGPNWKGKIPAGLKPVYFKYAYLNLFGRTLVEDDSTDLKHVLTLQHQACLTPLDRWPAEEHQYEGLQRTDSTRFYNSIDSFFVNLNNALKLSPAPERDKPILIRLSVLGVGTPTGFSWTNYNNAAQQRIHNRLVQTDSLLEAEAASGDIDFGNGWQRTNPRIGDWGIDYWDEALYMKHGFYAGHTEAEAFYIVPVSREGHGYFKGDHKYKIHFAKGSLPPLNKHGFWSITANEIPGYFLLANPIHRFAIRDRTKGLKFNADGSLDIYIQADQPDPDKKSNWLPIARGESTTTFRVYLPKKQLLNGTYKLPPIERVE
jgi:hypothetical protein